MDKPDAQLVQWVLEGNQQAYEDLVSRYQAHVYALAYSLVDNWAEAQDITQEAFIRAYVNLGQLQSQEKFAPWLRRVAFSVAMDWLRTSRPGLFRQLDGKVDLDRLEIPDFSPGPPEVAEKRELAQAVLAAVASLPPKYRLPLTMFHIDGLSYQKVANFLDIPVGTAKGLIHRARAKVKAVLPAVIASEVAPAIQEVLNGHRLPPAFSREVWGVCMDWLSSAEGAPTDPKTQQAIALAAARDPDVAGVNEWRRQAEPIPRWAVEVDSETPRWGIEIWHYRWIEQLERSVWMIGRETSLPGPPPGRCGVVGAWRRQWGLLVGEALDRWLAGKTAGPGEQALIARVHSLLGPGAEEKAGAVRLLRDTLRLVTDRPEGDFETHLAKLPTGCRLAEDIRGAMKYLQFQYSYRWEKNVLALCRIVGEAEDAADRPLLRRVREYGDELGCAHDDDFLRVSATRAILVGLWAWLREMPPEAVRSAYPAVPLALRVPSQLGDMTPAKRWLAGRLFVGIRIWLQQMDDKLRFWHQADPDGARSLPAMEPYPTLTQE